MTNTAPTVAVTGSTGFIGGRVTRTLADRGIAQRLIVRDAARAPDIEGAEVAAATYADDDAARAALSGIETLFMVSGTESADRLAAHLAFVDAAQAAGVQRVVYLSFFGAAPDARFTLARDHWHTEQHIRASGMAHTFLRDNLYADFLSGMAGDDGVIRGPAGAGAFAPVARRDVADVAARVLSDTVLSDAVQSDAVLSDTVLSDTVLSDTVLSDTIPSTTVPADPPATKDGRIPDGRTHDGRTYDLTGPDLITMADAAAILTATTGRRVSYHDETEAEAYASRAVYVAPDWQLRAWVSTYQAIAAGELAPVSQDVPRLLGRPATSLADLLRAG